MISERRKLLKQLLVLAAMPFSVVAAEPFNWKTLALPWFSLLLPKDELGSGGGHPMVIEQIELYMQDRAFASGFEAGLRALSHHAMPKNERELTSFYLQDSAESRFLRAMMSLLVDSYYGEVLGWEDVSIQNPVLAF